MLKKYASMVKGNIQATLHFRLSLFVTTVGNLLYLLLIFNLWKAIFASSDSPTINGMSFSETMIYLVLASALFNFMEMWIVWNMGREIQTGQIVVDLLKPVGYRAYKFFGGFGECVVKLFTTFLPTAIVVFFVSDGAIKLGLNVLLFVISAFMSLAINYFINFMVGTICMYTESIWGVNIVKVVIVNLLSGATVPIAFFPPLLKSITMFLPFQAIINSPLELLLHPEYGPLEILRVLGLQLFWVLALNFLSEGFFRVSLRRITINGG